MLTFNALEKKHFEITVGKGENTGNQYFLLFPKCLLPHQRKVPSFESKRKCCLKMLTIWSSLKSCPLEKGLIHSLILNLRPSIIQRTEMWLLKDFKIQIAYKAL